MVLTGEPREMQGNATPAKRLNMGRDCDFTAPSFWVNPKFCVNAESWCKIEQNNVKAGAAQAAPALSIK